jgi:protein TonB
VFDDVTRKEGGKTVARKGAFLLGSSALQGLAVLVIIAVSARIAAKVAEEPIVDVKFLKGSAPPPPPPPKRRTTKKVERKPVNPSAMIQPKDIPTDLSPPDPEDDGGVEGGVEGGVIGGVVGGVVGGSLDEAPVYATAGYKKPSLDDAGCIRSSIRIPKELQGFISKVTVKFAVSRDGSTDLFQFMTQVPDKRIEDAVKSAVRNCKFNPGTDAQGKPVRIWVIMPIQFQGG